MVPTQTIIVIFLNLIYSHAEPQQGISKQILENWSSKFGGPLYEFGRSVTKYNELQNRFQHSNPSSSVKKIELDKLIVEMQAEINTALREKAEAVRKIMLSTEQKALEYHESEIKKLPQTYYSAKKLNREGRSEPKELYHVVGLAWNPHFGALVNTSFSSVHVPTSIYEKKTTLLEAIGWTSGMDTHFESNYNNNPTLSYQYFGSSTGFLRQYPATKWPNSNSLKSNPDLFDARTRPWYTSAANSPKNMIILQDVSGSMTGLRREIAKHVVSTILDTLTENDYVNVYNFSEDCAPVVPCFGGSLVQANLENVRSLKDALDQDHTAGVANFSAALNTAFDLLEKQLPNNVHSSGCNQAIMIITDGAPYPFEEIFRMRQNPMHAARVFTYLIGRDVTDKREVMYMACANDGYYAHVSTLSEVQEQVLKYIPVMSRPLVMHSSHQISWTPVYSDVADPSESDWSWADVNSKQQYVRSDKYKKFLKSGYRVPLIDEEEMVENLKSFLDGEDHLPPQTLAISAKKLSEKINRIFEYSEQPEEETMKKKPKHNFIVSVSVPVFDVRNATKEGDRIASLLGVAGTDIPIKELQKMTSPFKLGVNGYAFLVNNNGYVVFHPDWRPVYKDELLKPNYNAVDVAEVELGEGEEFLKNDTGVMEMRSEMLDLDHAYRTLKIKIHQDDFHRLTLRKQKYEYAKLRQTPYTLALSVPQGLNQFHGQMELFLERDAGLNLPSLFSNEDNQRRWSVNPNWSYCEYVRGGNEFENKEEELLHFLQKIQNSKRGWKWKNTGVGIKQRHGKSGVNRGVEGEVYECDRDLVQSLAFDANVTEVFTEKKLWKINREDKKLIALNGATLAFISTRSGLTRWIDFTGKTHTVPPIPPTATDSLSYQRAVDRYILDPDSFVFSVPFDAGTKNDSKVTATRAVFVSKNGLEAPVAVVGVQYKHSEWAGRFFDITSTCVETSTKSNYVDGNCKKTCDSGEYDCFVLDDNGFILISEKQEQTGRFFGEIDGMVMEMLVNSDVYKKVRIVDHQAVCFQPVHKANFANFLQTPLNYIQSLLLAISSTLLKTIINLSSTFAQSEYLFDDLSDTLHPFLELASINKTRLRPCDKETFLYTYGSSYNTFNFSYHGLLTKCGHNSGCDGYFNVHFIPHTNLILVVTDGKCRCGMNSTSIKMKEIEDITDNECSAGVVARQSLYRTRQGECVSYNANEREIRADCGLGNKIMPTITIIISIISILLY